VGSTVSPLKSPTRLSGEVAVPTPASTGVCIVPSAMAVVRPVTYVDQNWDFDDSAKFRPIEPRLLMSTVGMKAVEPLVTPPWLPSWNRTGALPLVSKSYQRAKPRRDLDNPI